jgi:hypothetical protein
MRERSEEDERLDILADKLSGFVEGWQLEDVARVCASIAAAAIAMSCGTAVKRENALLKLIGFMRESIQRMAVHIHDPNDWKH